MSLATGDDDEANNDKTDATALRATNDKCPGNIPKIVPVSLHDASLQALLTSVPQLSPVLSHSSRTVASSSSSCHSQETSPTSTRHPFCIDRSILVRPPRRFTHKRNKSAPIWLHNPSSVIVPRSDAMIQRRNSFDELYKLKGESPSLPIKFASTGSTDEGVGLGYESGSVSTPSTEDKIDDKSIDSCINSCDMDEAYNTDSSHDYSGYPGLVSSATWIEVNNEQTDSDLVCVKVGSKSSHVVHFSVKAGDVITWEFATVKRDIGFGILFECSVVEERELKDGEITDVDSITSGYGVIPILPIFKVKSNISPIFGSHEAVTDGVYVMTWDNSYSRFFAKDLFYRISTQTEIYTSEYPHGIISFQHSVLCTLPLCTALQEVEEDRSRDSSETSEVNENTLCDSSDTDNNKSSKQQDNNKSNKQHLPEAAPTLYFDVSQHVQDL